MPVVLLAGILWWLLLKNSKKRDVGISVQTKVNFNPEHDTMVFFHMQKTGGTTFNTFLVTSLETSAPCICGNPPEEGACRCRDHEGFTWLFSRFTMSSACGVHPPLVDLRNCAGRYLTAAEGYDTKSSRRFLYLTVLRHPVKRYFSEWQHVKKNGQWPLSCATGDKDARTGENWSDMSLEDFMKRRRNPANNRQVRMLGADFREDTCRNLEESSTFRTDVLEAAKLELRMLDYVGLLEFPHESQVVFEKTFGVKFKHPFVFQKDSVADVLVSSRGSSTLTEVERLNELDLQLYVYAEQLLMERYRAVTHV